MWAGLMATFIRGKGFSVQIVDAEAEGLSAEQTQKRVADLEPLLVVVVVYGHQPSATTQTMPAAGDLCKAIKQTDPQMNVIMVGGHVASLPGRTLGEEHTDFVCNGEGPYTVLDLVQALKGGRSEDLHKVRGMVWRDGDDIRTNTPAPLVQNPSEEMAEVAWDLLPVASYRAHNWHTFGDRERQPYVSIYTTLGCPYRCTFCCIQAPFKAGEKLMGFKETVNSYRLWKPEVVVAQIDKLVTRYGVRNIKIADEMFVLNRNHVETICDLLAQRGYDLNIWAYARVDTVKDGMVEKLKRAGFAWLAIGIEAANERVRVDVQKGFGQDLIYQTLHKVRSGGINVIGNYIFGLPEDDLESMQETLDMALNLNCEFANFYSAMAYPGSALYDMAVRQGLPLPEKWSGYSQHAIDTLPLPTKYLSGMEVLRFRDHAFQEYYNSPKYLEMIARTFGQGTVQHIREMTAMKLVRERA